MSTRQQPAEPCAPDTVGRCEPIPEIWACLVRELARWELEALRTFMVGFRRRHGREVTERLRRDVWTARQDGVTKAQEARSGKTAPHPR